MRSLGLAADRPLLGVAVRALAHKRRFVPRKVRAVSALATGTGAPSAAFREPGGRDPAAGAASVPRCCSCRAIGFRTKGPRGFGGARGSPRRHGVGLRRSTIRLFRQSPPALAGGGGIRWDLRASWACPVGLATTASSKAHYGCSSADALELVLGVADGWLDAPVQGAFAASCGARDRTAALAQRVRAHTAALLH